MIKEIITILLTIKRHENYEIQRKSKVMGTPIKSENEKRK
jgi:hypothetical protein